MKQVKNESIDINCYNCKSGIWTGEHMVLSGDGKEYCPNCAEELKNDMEEEFDDLIFGDFKKEAPQLCKARIQEIRKEYINLTSKQL